MQLRILETTAHSIRAGYECPCGCRPAVTYEQAMAPVHDGCCCGNEFAVGAQASAALHAKTGYRAESTAFGAPWGETIEAAWLVGPSVHADASAEHGHAHDNGAAGHAHDHDGQGEDGDDHDGQHDAVAIDPVCGMTVERSSALAKGLHLRHQGRDHYFCGRGCKLDFEEDPARYLDPSYVPSM